MGAALRDAVIPVDQPGVRTYTVPTDYPEADGTIGWNSTTMVLVEVGGGGRTGMGYSYTSPTAAGLIRDVLAPIVVGANAMNIGSCWDRMVRAVRNVGRPGLAACAIAAVDAALWDLKAKLLQLPLVNLLGAVRDAVPAYGSGGFTSYPDARLAAQLGGWAEQGLQMVKMKVGQHPDQDEHRVRIARDAIGDDVELFVDANGALSRKQALRFAEIFSRYGVRWFEEPVSSDDLEGLRLLRDRAPGSIDIAAGEYGYDIVYFRRMLEAGAVDVLQADATRCCGPTGFLRADALCRAFTLPLSAHCAPALHAHLGCAATSVRHLEYFHDHARIEQMLFDGALQPADGALRPDLSRPGFGLELRVADAARYEV